MIMLITKNWIIDSFFLYLNWKCLTLPLRVYTNCKCSLPLEKSAKYQDKEKLEEISGVVFISLTGSGARRSLVTNRISSGGYPVDIRRISTGGIYDFPAQNLFRCDEVDGHMADQEDMRLMWVNVCLPEVADRISYTYP